MIVSSPLFLSIVYHRKKNIAKTLCMLYFVNAKCIKPRKALYKSDKNEQCFEKISSFFSKKNCVTMLTTGSFSKIVKVQIRKEIRKLCKLKRGF
jgi:hypothetical protein